MIYLLWTLFNLAFLIFFIIICFRATRLVKEKSGIAAAFIFAIGLLAFINKEPKTSDLLINQVNHPSTFTLKQNANISQPISNYIVVPVEKYVGSTLNLDVSFIQEPFTGNVTPSTIGLSVEGFVGGHKWEPMTAHIYPTSSQNVYLYDARVVLKWAILGFPIYSQLKEFSGSFDLKN